MRDDPLFVAVESICYYPISTLYDSCPRYLFYALLVASCVSRWTGWLVNVFLGTAATYAGTAAFQSFILVASPQVLPPSGLISIPYISSSQNNTTTNLDTLSTGFPNLIKDKDTLLLRPAAVELDGDAVLAVVVTGYLVFLPLQCWSRILSDSPNRARTILFCLWNILMLTGSICALVYWPITQRTPTQYTFCYPYLPPWDPTSSDGWQASWRTSPSWNESVWAIFTNETRFEMLGDLCFNPCFNTSQVLRRQSALSVSVTVSDPDSSWEDGSYSQRYIYTLIVLCVVLNCFWLGLTLLPWKPHIIICPVQPVALWKERRLIYARLKKDLRLAVQASRAQQQQQGSQDQGQGEEKESSGVTFMARRVSSIMYQIIRGGVLAAWSRFGLDVVLLAALLLSIVVSPLTVIAFVVWIEYYIRNDGPAQESPQQVGQWTYLLSIGLLMISAGILKLRYWVASRRELDWAVEEARRHLEEMQRIRDSK